MHSPPAPSSLLSRRRFLGAAIATSLATALARAEIQKTSAPQITLGFSTYGTQALATEEAISTLAKIGYDSVELAVIEGWDCDPSKLGKERRGAIRQRLKDAGLRLTSLMENVPPSLDDKRHQKQLDRLKAAAELAHELAPDRPPIIETVLGGKKWEDSKPLFLKRLPDWIKLAEGHETIVALKPHRGSAMSRPGEAIELFHELGDSRWLRMDYDYSHFWGRDMPMDKTIAISLPWTVFISVKDTAIVNGKEIFTLPGETKQIDYAALIKQFARGGYRGDLNCEVSSMISKKQGYDPIAAARKSYANLAPAFEAAGVARAPRL
jgi:inosose dehydratase